VILFFYSGMDGNGNAKVTVTILEVRFGFLEK
jgi:hypothetical protein